MENLSYSRRTGRRGTLGLCHLLALIACPAALIAQEQSQRLVKSVEFVGLQRTSRVFALDLVRIKDGDPVEAEALDRGVDRLLGSGRFISAKYTLADDADGVRVTFELTEQPLVSAIRFEGNKQLSEGNLGDGVRLTVGGLLDRFAVRDGRDAIIAAYREAGYGDAVVTIDWHQIEQTGEVVYNITEGPRIRIREIIFEGATVLSDRELKKQIETKTAFWIFRTGAFDEEQAEGDVARLQKYYRDEGFLDARVSYRRHLTGETDLRLVFTIVEGTRYTIETMRFHGNTVFSDEELAGVTGSRVGKIAKRTQIDADAQVIREQYWELGYIYARVRAIRVFSDTPGLVHLDVEINEGDQFRVGRVVVRGNARTKDKVVRRELNLYPPDDLLDLNEAKEAERRLRETRLFSSARIMPVGDQPGFRDLVIDVEEAEKAGDFLFAMGVTSNSGLVGSVVVDLQNFDLFDWPRSPAELFKFRSFFGGGQHLRIEAQPGTELNRFRIDFTEPYLLDKPIRLDLSAYFFERGRDGYVERRAGTTVSLGKRFERGLLRGWSGEIAARVENAGVDDSDLFAAREIHRDEGSHLLGSIKLTMVRDRTDSRFLPSSGNRLRLGYEQFVGDRVFGRFAGRYQSYKTVKTDLLGRKSILRLTARAGVLVGDPPIFERFFAGGTGSIRGFQFRGVGERSGLQDNNIGGDYLLLLGAEYSYPLIDENIRGHIFVDTGTAGSGAYRASIGTGIRLTIDVFGPVPLEFNLAAPILRGDGDEEQMFSFLFGGLF